MQMSYAQNLEDYVLDQVFFDIAQGTYVDVGGGHPVADNVSFFAYLKGWRGLIVEPQETLAAAYAGIRPRDTVVAHLAGRTDGEIAFHVVDGMHGLSSAVQANADSAAKYGASYRTVKHRVRPLSHLIDEAKLGAIDFLKIDVEGAEADVLAGIDFKRHRPRVILVEAVNPNTSGDEWKIWEPIILGAGYQFVFFDNLNRFYVAEEAAALKERFPKEPAAWDKVTHLWDCGRAAERADHPDRVLAETLIAGLFASLPTLSPEMLERFLQTGLGARQPKAETAAAIVQLVGTAEWPRADLTRAEDLKLLLASDRLRAGLGRIACMYDGGHLHE
ncbi:MAG: FkbM family methyltransferase [Hyphomicrobiaceae bacterium]|nr:FkbM family methyltransferase [Hyphomicrobiaceae bacterium]